MLFFEERSPSFFVLQGFLVFFFKPKIELVGRQWTRKSTLFAKLTSKIWPLRGVKKSFSVCFFEIYRVFVFFFFGNVFSYEGERF